MPGRLPQRPSNNAVRRPSRRDEPPAAANEQAAGRARHWWDIALVGAAYLLLACLLYWPVSPIDARHIVDCACADPAQEIWFLRWVPFALAHGTNPFLTSYVNAPYGANLAVNTSMPLLGLVGWPVTAALGPVATYNLMLRLALALAGASMYGVMRRYVAWRPAAFVAGLLFAFSPFMAGHAQRHLFMTFLPLVPLFVLLVDDWLVSCRRSSAVAGALVGVVAAVEFLISPEVVALEAIGVAIALTYLAVTHRPQVRDRVGRIARGLPGAALAFVAVAGYPLYELVAGPLRPSGPIHTFGLSTRYHADLLSPVLPTPSLLLAPHALLAPNNSLVAGVGQEPGMYVGIPLLLVLLYVAVRLRRLVIVQVLSVTMATAFVLALGPRLTVAGRSVLTPLPYAVFHFVPVVQNIEPARFALIVQFGVAALVAVGADRLHRWWRDRPSRTRRAQGLRVGVATLAAVAALLPFVPRQLSSAPTRAPRLFTSGQQRAIPDGALALTFPFATRANEGMLWQALGGMRFRILGGLIFVPDARGRSTALPTRPVPPVLLPVLRGNDRSTDAARRRSEERALDRLCRDAKVDVVLASMRSRGSQRFVELVDSTLGSTPVVVGDVAMWLDVQGDLSRVAASP